MARVVERAQKGEEASDYYRYRRTTTTEELNGKGECIARQDKLEDMVFHAGRFFRKKIRQDGSTALQEKIGPDGSQVAHADESQSSGFDLAEYKRYKRGEYTQYLTADVIARYDFRLEKRIWRAGRPTLQISFRPKKNRLPASKLLERFFNEFSGMIWVDEREWEVARLHVKLDSSVRFFGGIAGVVHAGEFNIERIRVDEGVWFNRVTLGTIRGRKFLQPTRVTITSVSDRFEKLEGVLDDTGGVSSGGDKAVGG